MIRYCRQFILVLIALAGFTACSSTPIDDHYYSLVLAADDVPNVGNDQDSSATLAIAPVELAPFLDQYNLVIQIGSAEVRPANHHFWAEPLDRAIAKVLAKDLNALSDDVTVVVEAGIWTEEPQCHLRVEFDEFHATTDSGVVAGGQYWLRGDGGNGAYAFEFRGDLSGGGYAEAVDVMRNLLKDVAGMISESIESGSNCETVVTDDSGSRRHPK